MLRMGSLGYKVKSTRGKKEEQVHFYGYKTHVSMNTGAAVTGLEVSDGNVWDGKRRSLVKDMKQGLRWKPMLPIRGYDDGNNHYYRHIKACIQRLY